MFGEVSCSGSDALESSIKYKKPPPGAVTQSLFRVTIYHPLSYHDRLGKQVANLGFISGRYEA